MAPRVPTGLFRPQALLPSAVTVTRGVVGTGLRGVQVLPSVALRVAATGLSAAFEAADSVRRRVEDLTGHRTAGLDELSQPIGSAGAVLHSVVTRGSVNNGQAAVPVDPRELDAEDEWFAAQDALTDALADEAQTDQGADEGAAGGGRAGDADDLPDIGPDLSDLGFPDGPPDDGAEAVPAGQTGPGSASASEVPAKKTAAKRTPAKKSPATKAAKKSPAKAAAKKTTKKTAKRAATDQAAKKSASKQTPAKKTPAKKTATAKSPATQTAAKKTPAKKTAGTPAAKKSTPPPEPADLPAAAVEAGAPGAATAIAEEVAQQVAAETGGGAATVPDADALPLEDFDQLSLASLRGRLRRLDVAELVALRDYEQAHAHRLQVITMLENRIAKLEVDQAGSGS